MTRTRIQSALREARDQLFLDTADSQYLDTVANNIGVERPDFGFSDDRWRYVIKEVGLQAKQVRNIFHRLLETILGPQKTRIGTFDIAPEIGESIIQLQNSENLLQLGRITLDPGQDSEETVNFSFRDLETQKVFLNADLEFDHTAADDFKIADTNLTFFHAAGAITLTVQDSSLFPVTGPYSVILDRGTASEETAVVLSNDTSLNELTLADFTVLDHNGAKVGFLRKPLERNALAGRLFIVLDENDTVSFPAAGFVRLAFGESNEETVEYESNDLENNALVLKRPLSFSHTAGETVELMTPGATVETCNVVQYGVDWAVYETQANKVIITIPSEDFENTIYDVSFWHDATLDDFSTSLDVNLENGDSTAYVVDSTGLAFAGIVEIDGNHFFYAGKDDDTGALSLAEMYSGATILAGEPVDAVIHAYGGTDLEEGSLFDTEEFPGPYIFDESSYAPSETTGFLDVTIPAPTRVAADQVVGAISLEVVDASDHPEPPFSPYKIRVGFGTGEDEVVNVTDRTLASEVTAEVDSLATFPVSTIDVDDNTAFPEGDGVNPLNYRIIIDRDGPNEEILLVSDMVSGAPGTFTLDAPTTITHAATETIHLVNDVLNTDSLTLAHLGNTTVMTADGHLVEYGTEELPLGTGEGTNFPDEGKVYINFGKERINVRQKIVSATATTLVMSNSSLFPTAGFPYKITVGQGAYNEEVATVTANDTGTDTLTVDTMTGTFLADQYVEFIAGTPATVDYTDKDGDSLVLGEPTYLDSKYTAGERVMLTNGLSTSEIDGSSFAFRMPPDRTLSLASLIDMVRAAGVEVEFIIKQVDDA